MNRGVERCVPVMANREFIKLVSSYDYAQQRHNVTPWDNDPNLRLKPAWDKAAYWYNGTYLYDKTKLTSISCW